MVTPVRGTALVRRPSPRLAEGIVTHIERTPVDVGKAMEQHAGYAAALAAHGWSIAEVPPADESPDSVFVEDTVVVCDGLAVITRPGALQRRPETQALDSVIAGVPGPAIAVARIEPPGTLDGGDVLQVGTTVYVGQGGRTNAEGIRQLAALLAGRGRTVVAVPLGSPAGPDVLHLKSAVTALPDGTFLAWDEGVDRARFAPLLTVPEEPGAHVVPLGGQDVLIAASAPATAELLADRGWRPVVVDISEFERLEGCVTCLSVLIGP